MPYPYPPTPPATPRPPLIGSLQRFVVIVALWWLANVLIWSAIWAAQGSFDAGHFEIEKPLAPLFWPSCPAIFLAPPAAALSYFAYRLVCRLRRIKPRRVFPPSAFPWPAGPIILAVPIWLYGCIYGLIAFFTIPNIGDLAITATDLLSIPASCTFWGLLIAFPTGFIGIPLTAIVTFGISWIVRRILHRRSAPAGLAPTGAGWGDRFEG